LVLVPFFIVIKKFTPNQTFDLIKEYLIKCNELKPLNPSIKEFEKRIKIAIEKSIDSRIPPIRIKNLRNKYLQWYDFLKKLIF
jgi:hypothetical protein